MEQKKTDSYFLNFIEENKKEIFRLFYENSPYFPNHCTDIAYVLGMHYEAITTNKALIQKRFKKHYSRNQWHRVLKVGNHYVDFSLFQFYTAKPRFKKLSLEEAYAFAIDELQGGIVVFDETYLHRFTDEYTTETIEDLHPFYPRSEGFLRDYGWNEFSKEVIQKNVLAEA